VARQKDTRKKRVNDVEVEEERGGNLVSEGRQ